MGYPISDIRYPCLLQIPQAHVLVTAILFLVGILLALVLFMLIYLLCRKYIEKKKSKWRTTTDFLVQRAIFFDGENEPQDLIPLTSKIRIWLRNPHFRQVLIDELVNAGKSLSGKALDNLLKLFGQLDLQKDSIRKLSSLKWHIRARGIQELAVMDRKDMLKRIYRLTNNRNEFVRMEAQTAIVQLYGFEGLRFLDVVSYPISEWQQIKLLGQLPGRSSAFANEFESWLRSPNDSVIMFALKLAAINHRYELHDCVAACLDHRNVLVRIQAVKCLRDIPGDSTAEKLIGPYPQQGKAYRSAVLDILQGIATDREIPFLRRELSDEDDALKLAAARVLARIGARGNELLDSFERAGEYPWNEIIRQAKSETAV
jgi:hypothetical protein